MLCVTYVIVVTWSHAGETRRRERGSANRIGRVRTLAGHVSLPSHIHTGRNAVLLDYLLLDFSLIRHSSYQNKLYFYKRDTGLRSRSLARLFCACISFPREMNKRFTAFLLIRLKDDRGTRGLVKNPFKALFLAFQEYRKYSLVLGTRVYRSLGAPKGENITRLCRGTARDARKVRMAVIGNNLFRHRPV